MLKKMLVVAVLSAATTFAVAGEIDAVNQAQQVAASQNEPIVTHSQGITRAQVLAELAEAQRTGNILDTHTGKMLNELYPSMYPPKPVVQGETRGQVLAELAEAQRTGNILDTHTGKMLNELYPSMYPPKPVVQGETRAQVLAELAEAQRTGNMLDAHTGKMLNELYPAIYKNHS